MENVLVTGGAGFIGQNVVRRLLYDGKNVWVIDNFSTGGREVIARLKNENDNLFLVDGHTERMAISDYADIDTIFHFSSPCSMQQFKKAPVQCMETTVASLMTVMELARQNGAFVVYPSSGSVYGNANGAQKETDVPNPPNFYGMGKIISERIAEQYRKQFNVRSIGLRIFAGYGMGEEQKGEIASAVTLFLDKMLEGKQPEIWGDGTQGRDFVFISDVVEMMMRCVANPKTEVINVGSGESMTFNQVVATLNDALGKDIKPKYVPKPADYLENTKADMTMARRLYDFNPTQFKDGVRRYVDYRLSKDVTR